MPFLECSGLKLEVDKEGFLGDADSWNKEIAEALAKAGGIEDLTADHWTVVNYIREYYLGHGLAPTVRNICKETGYNLKYIYQLFTAGPAKGACKVAGLPKPDGCV